MCRAILTGLTLSVLLVGGARADVPPGYEIVQLTDNLYFEYQPAINNRGQIVFTRRLGAGPDHLSDEIFLYDDGELIRLTDDDVQDMCPHINDEGTIVWSRRIGADDIHGPTLEVVMWREGEMKRLTDDALNDYVGGINSRGHVVWYKWIRGGCHDANSVICFYDARTVAQISDADWSHQGAVINDDGWIAWTRYNFCEDPWTSDIMLYRNGVTMQLTDGQQCPQMEHINNRGQVVWQFHNPQNGRKALELWEDGETTLLTDWGMNARLNDYGDVYFIRWYDDDEVYQAWLYLNSSFYQLTDDPFWNIDGDINNAGEAVWHCGGGPRPTTSGC